MNGLRRVKKLRGKVLEDQPHCIYCGGKTPANSVDHVPPKAVFDQKHRPSGLEFAACRECHDGTRLDDLVVTMASRIFPDPETEEAQEELAKSLTGVKNNVPGLLEEMRPSFRQSKKVRRLSREIGDSLNALNFDGPIMNKHIARFAGRIGCALHFELTKSIIPPDGGIGGSWFTNYNVTTGTAPEGLLEILPSPSTLKQGKWGVDDQFLYSSVSSDNGNLSVHCATFRSSFGVWVACSNDFEKVTPPSGLKALCLFQPGFLKN